MFAGSSFSVISGMVGLFLENGFKWEVL